MKYIPSGQDGDCTAALLRFMDRFSLEACCDLVDFTRTKPLGSWFFRKDSAKYHKAVLSHRHEHAFMPVWKELY